MGASAQNPQKQSFQLPKSGSKIIKILKPELQKNLNIYTDYIIHVPTISINIQMQNIELIIYSILSYAKRKQLINFNDFKTGLQMINTKVNDCMLKVTKVFSGSPFQKCGISAEQYIVGLQKEQFQNLKEFVDKLKKIMNKKLKTISIIICDKYGKSRTVCLSTNLIDEWKSHNKGILGCELAQGWANRFIFNKNDKKDNITLKNVQNLLKLDKKQTIQISQKSKQLLAQNIDSMKRQDSKSSSQNSEQIQKRLNIFQDHNRVIQKSFKGILKEEKIQDAQYICKCKIYDKNCQKCFIIKDNHYYFFNKKTTRIINIPANLLFPTD